MQITLPCPRVTTLPPPVVLDQGPDGGPSMLVKAEKASPELGCPSGPLCFLRFLECLAGERPFTDYERERLDDLLRPLWLFYDDIY